MNDRSRTLSRIVLFERLRLRELPFALLFRLAGFDVRYLVGMGCCSSERMFGLLAALGIQMQGHEAVDMSFVGGNYENEGKFGAQIYDYLFGASNAGCRLAALLGGGQPVPAERLAIALRETIDEATGSYVALCRWAEMLQRTTGARVYVFAWSTSYTRLVKRLSPEYRVCNLCPFPSLGIEGLAMGLFRRIGRTWGGLCRRGCGARGPSCVEENSPSTAAVHPESEGPERFRVLFFPHKGVEYGKLFRKDYFYEADPTSPFHPGNIMHVEYCGVADGGQGGGRSVGLVPFRHITELARPCTVGEFLAFLVSMLKPATGYNPLGDAVSRGGFARWSLCFSAFRSFSYYRTAVARFPKARIALIGYDYLFPKFLALALSVRKIRMVAVQERFVQLFYGQVGLICDEYLVASELCAQRVRCCRWIAVKNVVPVGMPRLDLLYRTPQTVPLQNLERLKGKYRIIIALDYHSNGTEQEDRMVAANNWQNNLLFYRDLIRLAIRYPSIYVIIRGKNDHWCALEYFRQIRDVISWLPNTEVNHDYGEFNISYRLASAADAIIARHTSLVDEAVAAGIPAVVCDYYSSGTGLMQRACPAYEGLPIFAYSYDELEQRMDRFLKEGTFADRALLERESRRLYDCYFDGQVRTRIGRELNRIYCEGEPEMEA